MLVAESKSAISFVSGGNMRCDNWRVFLTLREILNYENIFPDHTAIELHNHPYAHSTVGW